MADRDLDEKRWSVRPQAPVQSGKKSFAWRTGVERCRREENFGRRGNLQLEKFNIRKVDDR